MLRPPAPPCDPRPAAGRLDDLPASGRAPTAIPAPAPAAPAVPPELPPGGDALLATLVQLEARAREAADVQALAFLMVNETYALARYRQAVLWQREAGGPGAIVALSGLALPDPQAPLNTWLAAVLARHAAAPGGSAPGPLTPPAAGDDGAMWAEHLPAHAWWLPLPLETARALPAGPGGRAMAGLLLLRESPWLARETAVLALAAAAYAHAWRALREARRGRGAGFLRRAFRCSGRRRWALAAIAAGLLVLLLPLRQSVLAPAEVVARSPEAVRAPLQGVVDHIEVQPNQTVARGQLLATLDARELQGQIEADRQTLAVADAQWRRAQQQALFDEQSKSELAILQGKRDQAAADVDYAAQALQRTRLRATRSGIALFDDPSDWLGKPVALGERIMLIADPHDVELEVQLPVADAIDLPAGAEVRLFPNTAPTSPFPARLLRVAYRAAPTPEGILAFRVRARFLPQADAQALQVGMRGTAKLYGRRTLLVAYLLRRPLTALRTWLGW